MTFLFSDKVLALFANDDKWTKHKGNKYKYIVISREFCAKYDNNYNYNEIRLKNNFIILIVMQKINFFVNNWNAEQGSKDEWYEIMRVRHSQSLLSCIKTIIFFSNKYWSTTIPKPYFLGRMNLRLSINS